MTPKISIVTPVYNRERYIGSAIESVLNQTMGDFELVVWDDGSTDRSLDIAHHYARFDSRVRVVAAEHRGVVPAVKAAYAATTGIYIGSVDSDDLLAPTALEETAAVLDAHPEVGLVYTAYQVIDDNGEDKGPGWHYRTPYSKDRLLIDLMTFHFRLIRRCVYDQVGGIDESLERAEDCDLCLKLSEVTEVQHIPKPLYYYRWHEGNMTKEHLEAIRWASKATSLALKRRGLDKHYKPHCKTKELDISVLFATRNRMGLLERTLSHLLRQEVNNISWELIVIDNASHDDTPSVLARFQEKLPLIVLQESQLGKNRALNRGLEVAKGDLLVFTDDDVEPEPSWLAELFAASRRWTDSSIFGGTILPIYPPEMPVWLQEDRYAKPFYAKFVHSVHERLFPSNKLPFGPNFAVRAKALNGLRFSPNVGPQGKSYPMGGETELLQRLVARGETVVYVPTAVVRHFVGQHQIETEWLFQRSFNFGRGTARLKGVRNLESLIIDRQIIERTLSGMNEVNPMGHDRTSLEQGIKYNYLQGILFEYNKLEAESKMVSESVTNIF